MAFDIEGSGSSMELNIDTLSSRLWPGGRVPYRFELHLSKLYLLSVSYQNVCYTRFADVELVE